MRYPFLANYSGGLIISADEHLFLCLPFLSPSQFCVKPGASQLLEALGFEQRVRVYVAAITVFSLSVEIF